MHASVLVMSIRCALSNAIQRWVGSGGGITPNLLILGRTAPNARSFRPQPTAPRTQTTAPRAVLAPEQAAPGLGTLTGQSCVLVRIRVTAISGQLQLQRREFASGLTPLPYVGRGG